MTKPPELCPDDALLNATEVAADDSRKGLRRLDELLDAYADDARLHFLKGSVLAGLKRYAEAVGPMREAIEISPDYHLARFQLGLLHLSSGEAEAAREVWRPLSGLGPQDPLRLFAEGLQQLAQDAFGEAERLLRVGMARNQHYPALNADMQLVLDSLPGGTEPSPPDPASSQADWLLRAAASRQTKH
jgi:Flp pilus assembly protein TadD